MDALFHYIQAINAHDSGALISESQVSHEQSEDEWSTMVRTTQTVRFANGAVVQKIQETEQAVSPNPDVVCADCWLSYEVLSDPDEGQIRPRQKQFSNLCQQAFWLKVQAAQFC